MIHSISDIINEFILAEVEILNNQKIKHPPTIGKMYEGLTESIFNQSIFKHLNLKVIKNSFIIGCDKEFDVMLVEGEGKKIPYTNNFKYEPEKVIAIVQVKKNLYSKDLKEGNDNLRFLVDYYKEKELEPFNYKLFNDSFRSICKKDLTAKLTLEEEGIYSTLRLEALLPARIIWGYNGFKSEYNFRNSFVKYIEKNITTDFNNPTKYFGPQNFPNLIISGNYSMIKANGMPFITTMNSGFWWTFLITSSYNPTLHFLEIIWTKLSYKYDISAEIFGEDLAMEPANRFIDCRAIKINKINGWEFNFIEMKKNSLQENTKIKEWEPVEIDEIQNTIINELCNSEEINLITDKNLETYIKTGSYQSLEEFLEKLKETGLVTINDNKLRLITDQCQCAILPDGRFVAGENRSGRFTNWIMKQLKNK